MIIHSWMLFLKIALQAPFKFKWDFFVFAKFLNFYYLLHHAISILLYESLLVLLNIVCLIIFREYNT
jgi:hypothetical protein